MPGDNKHNTILFDLFDTLILFEPELLPRVRIAGREKFSTALPVFEVFTKYFEDVLFENFYSYFIESYHQFQDIKNEEYREYTNIIRFDIMFRNMGLKGVKENEFEIKNALVDAHMESLAGSMVFPDDYRGILDHYKQTGYGMSVVSNFDHAPTAYKLLDINDITHYFDKIFISDEIGWRKPHPEIFRHVLNTLERDAAETVLVGDDYKADIIGASNMGIDTVYIDRKKSGYATVFNYKISDLKQLTEVI